MSGDALKSMFEVHAIAGSRDVVISTTERLLHLVTSHWRRRQLLGLALATLFLVGGGVLMFLAAYAVGLFVVLAGVAALSFGLATSRYLEIEVETVMLLLAILEHFAEAAAPDGPFHVVVDLRSSVHASKHADARSGVDIEDHWFTVQIPLATGPGLRLVLKERVRNVDRTQFGRRVGRDYHVAGFRDHSFAEDALFEAVTSHVAAPSGTGVANRVRESLDAIVAAADQILAALQGPTSEAIAIEVSDAERASEVYNPRGRPA